MRILSASFIKSATQQCEWLDNEKAEIAFVGRSNVGKSSLLNRIVGMKGLAKVSSSPGRTRLINFFNAVTDMGEIVLVDLPGYGFAKVSRQIQRSFQPMISNFLLDRHPLKMLVLLVDSRRGATDLDMEMANFLKDHEIPFIVVMTKSDKIARTQTEGLKSKVSKELGVPKSSIMPFSVVTNEGIEDLLQVIGVACFSEDDE